MQDHARNIVFSHYDKTGEQLVPIDMFEQDIGKACEELFLLPNVAVLSHGIQQSEHGPVLNYANSAALQKFAASWDEITTMPSRYTAGEMDRELRENFMKTVRENGIIRNYGGIRVSKSGSKFEISNADVWNIVIDGAYCGQAAQFKIDHQ